MICPHAHFVPCHPGSAQCPSGRRAGTETRRRSWMSPVGPMQTFALAYETLREIRPTGRSAPRMSPESGCARLSSLISLRRAPRRPDPTRLGCLRVEGRRHSRPGPPGARLREIKGEPWAQAQAEDIRGGGHPVAPAGAMQERAGANVHIGPER